jgi:hypothetical protein
MYSSDGITWTSATSSLGVSWEAIIFGDNKFVAVANSTILASNAMYTTTPSDYNTSINIGTVGTSTITTQGNEVVIYPVPFYYAENTNALTLAANIASADITIESVPNGRYLVQIWMLSLLKQATASTNSIIITGSISGDIYTLSPTTAIGFVGTAGNTAVSTGPRYFQFAVYSNSSVGYQNITYKITSNTAGTVFTAGWLRTMTLLRIG